MGAGRTEGAPDPAIEARSSLQWEGASTAPSQDFRFKACYEMVATKMSELPKPTGHES